MALPRDLYDRDNVRRAWRWVRSNPDRAYKSYFRELYAAYSIAEDKLLERLGERLRRGIYEPETACKIYLPKKSGILRPYSLLAVEDQIAYQAAVNLVAEALFPRVRSRYFKEVFGHLYAGKSSTWFYRRWSDGYKAFNKAANDVFNRGFKWTASFDLTACYDSIDHKVIQHFLTNLRLSREFAQTLSEWLSKWTATDRNIFHGHGIPQGPLGSGLMAELVMSHFDDHQWAKMGIRYMRYVDDIRLFARNEKALRGALVRLDRLSKDIGLFPQSGKIDIHEVSDIKKELKSVSQPTEAAVRGTSVDQDKLEKRLIALSRRYSVVGTTRFKYLLAHAQPNSRVTARMWKIYEHAPEYYEPFARYLERYRRFPKKTAERVVQTITGEMLYPAIPAAFLRVARGRIPETALRYAKRQLKPLWKPRVNQSDLSAALGRWLVSVQHITDSQLEYGIRYGKPGWLRAQLLLEVSSDVVSGAALSRLVNYGLQDNSLDTALAAAYVAGMHGTKPRIPTRQVNDGAKYLLKEFGLIKRAAVKTCGIEISVRKLLGWSPAVDWKRFFGGEYSNAERQFIECRGYSETNATAWVNGLDVFNDYLLFALYQWDGTLGTYRLGHPGSVLNATGTTRLEMKYPRVFGYAKALHDKRAESLLSHPRVRTTGRATAHIRFSYIRTSKTLMRRALQELEVARLV